MLRGFGQELLEHFLVVVMEAVRAAVLDHLLRWRAPVLEHFLLVVVMEAAAVLDHFLRAPVLEHFLLVNAVVTVLARYQPRQCRMAVVLEPLLVNEFAQNPHRSLRP